MRSVLTKPTELAVVFAAVLVTLGGGGWALAASGGDGIHGCVNKKTGALRLAAHCKKSERAISWSAQGPAGAKGSPGTNGAPGTQGAPGMSGSPGTNGAPGATSVVIHTATVPIAGGASGGTFVPCPSGTSATGGGASGTDTLIDSFPYESISSAPAPVGWEAGGKNTSGSSENLEVYVICASP